MPELPEVENVKRKLEPLILNQQILDIEVYADRIIRTPDVQTFLSNLKGQTFKKIERKGKHLIFVLEKGYIVSHLRMEGKYEYTKTTNEKNKHDHVLFHFSNGYDLRYNDVRKFGTMDYVKDPNDVKSVAELGPEPLDNALTNGYLLDALSIKKSTIKHALLDQSVVAGLGNIYVDEVLYKSGLHPEKKANSVTKKQAATLITSIQDIISLAIEQGGSSVRSYNSLGEKGSMQTLHQVYGKNGESCPICQTLIEKIRVAGRGTHFCPICQKK
jgi:formamidopyrimidine-DNA glycosylase